MLRARLAAGELDPEEAWDQVDVSRWMKRRPHGLTEVQAWKLLKEGALPTGRRLLALTDTHRQRRMRKEAESLVALALLAYAGDREALSKIDDVKHDLDADIEAERRKLDRLKMELEEPTIH